MISIDELSKAYSLVEIPRWDGLAEPKIKYEHELDRKNEKRLLVKLVTSIEIHSVADDKVFKLFFCTYNYRVNITKSLTPKDLFSVWEKSAKDITKAFNKFERSKGMRVTNISYPNFEAEKDFYQDLVAWFYSPQN